MLLLAICVPAARAQDTLPAPVVPALDGVRIESIDAAAARDAGEYARRYGVTTGEAGRRLRAQSESIAVTDRLALVYGDRLAGITIEHQPRYRIVFALTGDAPVPATTIFAGGMNVPIVFTTGAGATRAAIVAAIARHHAAFAHGLSAPPGLGADPRTGELVAFVKEANLRRDDPAVVEARLTAMSGVPVRMRTLAQATRNLALIGGARVTGTDPADHRRYACTSGFVVTDGARDAIATAAHCPDALGYTDPHGARTALAFVGQWGARDQDVQVNAAAVPLAPLVYADSARSIARPITAGRTRSSLRAGDFVCHRGERTGYSCAEIAFTDYAPPGDLCGGPCDPSWVTVEGPSCGSGDSGAPVFDGTVALGIVKGASYRNGDCAFYFFMSLDYLPAGWSLRLAPAPGQSDPDASP